MNAGSHKYSSQSSLGRSLTEPEIRRHSGHGNSVVRPCYPLLLLLGMWKEKDGRFETLWRTYQLFVYLLWLASLLGILCLEFIQRGFRREIHFGKVMNSVSTCLNLLCPFVFTVFYFNHGQFKELVWSVQNASEVLRPKLQKLAKFYTIISLTLWTLAATFFMVHWWPLLSKRWQYVAYVIIAVYTTGWWAVWLSIYGFVCQVHTLQIDDVVEAIVSKDCGITTVLHKHQQLQNWLERTQKDFNIIISFALAYHTLDIIIFSFAYFDKQFGNSYELWQYVGGICFDLTSIIIKLLPPAIVASGVHRIVTQATKRCRMQTCLPMSTNLPTDEMQFFQYAAVCEPDLGLKILGIRITVELAGTILMTIVTAAVSFVAFVVPKLK